MKILIIPLVLLSFHTYGLTFKNGKQIDENKNDHLIDEDITTNNRIPDRADYNKEWDFKFDSFSLFDVNEYADRHYELWHDSYETTRMQDFDNWYKQGQCDQLVKTDKYMHVFTGNVTMKKYRPVHDCIMNLAHLVRMEVVREGKGKYTTKFFEEFIPHWLENEAFIFNKPRFEHRYQEEVLYDNFRYSIFYNYYTLAHWYGNDAQTDKQMLEWWEKQERKQVHAIWSRNADKCWKPFQKIDGSEFYPAGRMDQGTGLCGNQAAVYARMLQLTGLYHKNADYINESIWVAENILSGTDKDGATHDAIRGGQAPTYLKKTAWFLDAMAVDFDYYFDFDMYDLSYGEGTTVKDLIVYAFNVWHDPSLNHHYATLDENAKREINDVQGQEACADIGHQEECMSQVASGSDPLVGKHTSNTPEYKKYFRYGRNTFFEGGWRHPIIQEVRNKK